MPELPEVELFRHLLLPLVNSDSSGRNEKATLSLERVGENPRVQWTATNGAAEFGVESVQEGYQCTDVLRRGKQLCLVLKKGSKGDHTLYLYLHMGMTGSIRIPGRAENWGDGPEAKKDEITDESLPPKYTHLVFSSSSGNKTYTAYFCDPRKFGSCFLTDSLSDLDQLAPDAYTTIDPSDTVTTRILPALSNQRLGIKAILLDQKRVISGVGNWVADEVLYQCELHPDQTMLTHEEAVMIWHTLQSILTVAVHALTVENSNYPETWLFGYRWTKKQATNDAKGRVVTFLKSAGRTSAIVPSIQKLHARKRMVVPTDGDSGTKPAVRRAAKAKAVATNSPSTGTTLPTTPDLKREDATDSSTRSSRAKRKSSNTASISEVESLVDLPQKRRSPRRT